MLDGAPLLAFLGISTLVIVTPGQDTALTIRNTVLGGRRGGTCTAAGVAAGQAVWTIAASAGLAGLLLASQPAFLVLKIAGTAYLLWLGLQALREALRPSRAEGGAAAVLTGAHLGPLSAFRQGLISNLSNPKMVVFFITLLPQFAPPGGASFAPMAAHGLLFSLMTLTWLTVYAAAVARARLALQRPIARRVLHGTLGCVFVGLGARLATMQR